MQRGSTEDEEKPKNASLMKGMKPEDVTLEVALQLLSLPRELGPHPDERRDGRRRQRTVWPLCEMRSRNPQLAGRAFADGRYARSRRSNCWPSRRRSGAVLAPRENRCKVLEASPVTGQPIQLLEGRYGPYLTDGVTNASLPKQADPAAVTLAEALDLLAARAAAGPSTKKKFRRAGGKAAPAAAAKKKKAAEEVGREVENAAPAKARPVARRVDAAEKGGQEGGQESRPPSGPSPRKPPARAKPDARRRLMPVTRAFGRL